jgi:hypothetical protein
MGNGSPRLRTHLTRRVALVVLAALFGAPAAYADTLAPVVPASLPAVDPAATVASAVEPVAGAVDVEPAAPQTAVATALETVRDVAEVAEFAPVAQATLAAVRKQAQPVAAAVVQAPKRPAVAPPAVAPRQLAPSTAPVGTTAAPRRIAAQPRRVVHAAKHVVQPQRTSKEARHRAPKTAAPAAAPGSAVPGALEREARVIPHGAVAAVGAHPSPVPHAPHLSLATPLSHTPGTSGWTDAPGGLVSTGGLLVAALLGLLSLAWPRPGRRQAPRARLAHPVVPLLVLERPG